MFSEGICGLKGECIEGGGGGKGDGGKVQVGVEGGEERGGAPRMEGTHPPLRPFLCHFLRFFRVFLVVDDCIVARKWV